MRGSTSCYSCALQGTDGSYELEGVVTVSAFTCQNVSQCRQHQSQGLQGCLSGRKRDLFNCISYSHLKNPHNICWQLYKWKKEIAKGGKCWWCLLQSHKLHISHKFKKNSAPTKLILSHHSEQLITHISIIPDANLTFYLVLETGKYFSYYQDDCFVLFCSKD